MIHEVIVTNDFGESLELVLTDPQPSGLIVKSIDGLGPSKATINTTQLASSDGSVYNSARKEQKNIVFNFLYLEDSETKLVETSRLKTYKYFPLKKLVTLTFVMDHRIAEIQGYVESNEATIFDQQSGCQISIVCPTPFFTTSDRSMNLNGVESYFEFPFSNESLTENLINLGELVYATGTEYYYDGDAETGIYIVIHATGAVTNFSIYNSVTRNKMDFDTSKIAAVTKDGINNLTTGDTLEISTVVGNKFVRLTRAGKEYNVMAMLPKNEIDWLTVRKGANVFGYTAESGGADLQISIQTRILYEGV